MRRIANVAAGSERGVCVEDGLSSDDYRLSLAVRCARAPMTASSDLYDNKTTLVPLGCNAMPTTLTLKNIPDAVYERLKSAAEMHRRSLNSEAIVCLESVLLPTKLAPIERLARARELRAALARQTFLTEDIDLAKREGRS